MKKQPLTGELLDLILMVQSYRQLKIRESIFNNEVLGKERIDWYKETENYYNSLGDEILSKFGLATNIYSFEAVLNFEITDEMMKTESKNLNKFEFYKN